MQVDLAFIICLLLFPFQGLGCYCTMQCAPAPPIYEKKVKLILCAFSCFTFLLPFWMFCTAPSTLRKIRTSHPVPSILLRYSVFGLLADPLLFGASWLYTHYGNAWMNAVQTLRAQRGKLTKFHSDSLKHNFQSKNHFSFIYIAKQDVYWEQR